MAGLKMCSQVEYFNAGIQKWFENKRSKDKQEACMKNFIDMITEINLKRWQEKENILWLASTDAL